MTPDTITQIGQQVLTVTVQVSGPMLLTSLAIGLLISIFQAATQINEMTLTFVPKLIVMAILLMMTGSWMLQVLIDYTRGLFQAIPHLIS